MTRNLHSASSASDTLRHDVALSNRIIERLGLSHVFGHASARIAGTETFVIPTRRSPGLADEATLLLVDTDGNVVSGNGEPNSEFWIHARIYARRPDVGGIVHAHPHACVCLSQIGEPFRIVHNQGGAFVDGVSSYDAIGLIRTRALGDALAEVLGDKKAVIMRAHGITTVADNLRTATVAACFVEEGARFQLDMLASVGGDATRIRALTHDEARRVDDQLSAPIVARAWDYFAAVANARPIGAPTLP